MGARSGISTLPRRRSYFLFWLVEISGSRASSMLQLLLLPFLCFLHCLCSWKHTSSSPTPPRTIKTKSIHFNNTNEMDAIAQHNNKTTIHMKMRNWKHAMVYIIIRSIIRSVIHSLGSTFFVRRCQVQLTERAPVMRALCVRVAGRRRWYPMSGVPLLDGGFNMVSRLALLGALIDALRVFCRPPPCGGVDS